jgi:adenylyltransferase/sulfurtransferase
MGLSPEEAQRYARHLILPEIGQEGQRKLKAASVLILGAGGLGSPAAIYLAAAGVGRLGLVDFDVVDLSNLQRQIIHSSDAVGHSKITSAIARLHAVNPEIELEPFEFKLTSANALDVIRGFDVVIDGTDNFPSRYLINDACVLLGKPDVYGSIFRFEGQASVFAAEGGPCYRCLYPEPPPSGMVPDCAEAGVLGVLPAIIGSIQATEVLKLLLGIGDPLVGRMLLLDALSMRFSEFKFRRSPDCAVCGEHPSLTRLIDYDAFCHVSEDRPSSMSRVIPEISVQELKRRLDRKEEILILDVREPYEYQMANLHGVLIPLRELPERVTELDSSRDTVVHCHTGVRSALAVQFLRQKGFGKAVNLAGGVDRWAVQIDPSMRRY